MKTTEFIKQYNPCKEGEEFAAWSNQCNQIRNLIPNPFNP